MNRKHKALIEAINSGVITNNSADYLKESAENSIYKSFEGVSWDKPFREKILALRTKSNGQLTFNKIKRAVIFIEQKNGALIVKISCFEKIFLRLCTLVGGLILILSLLLTLLFILNLSNELETATSVAKLTTKLLLQIFLIVLFLFSAIRLLEGGRSLKLAIEVDEFLSRKNCYESGIAKCNIRTLLTGYSKSMKYVLKNIKSIY